MNREDKLKFEFNNFMISRLKLEIKDYYDSLTTKDFIELKVILSNINNIITLKLTLKFVDFLTSLFKFSAESKENIINSIQNINPNSNGFDVEIENPVKIVAEVKGNFPINNGISFGAAQKTGIIKDLHSLKNGKSKSSANTQEFYKFLVLPDAETTRKAANNLLNSLKNNINYKDYSFEIINENTKILNEEKIYVVFIKID
jgi:hypothetical protein